MEASNHGCLPENYMDNNPQPQQQWRVEHKPFDDSLQNHPIFRSHIFNKISLPTLESESTYEHRLNFKYIGVQIVQIVTSNLAAANIYYRKKVNININTMKFSHLILARVHSTLNPTENSRLDHQFLNRISFFKTFARTSY